MKNKIKYIILATVFLLAININAAEEVDVTNFIQNVHIGEENIELPSVVYKNENYVKLRDFSYILKNLEKDYKIIYNNKNKQISAITAYPYEPIGTELTPIDEVKKAEKSTAKFDINNEQKDFNAIIIKGHNYFRLRDLCEAFKIKVVYDITERIAYMTVLDGNANNIKPGQSLPYKNVETTNPLTSEGFISSVDGTNLKVTFAKKFHTGGYQLRCERVIYDGENIIIKPLIISPPADSFVTQAITYPNCTIEIDIKGVKPGYKIIVEGLEQSLFTE